MLPVTVLYLLSVSPIESNQPTEFINGPDVQTRSNADMSLNEEEQRACLYCKQAMLVSTRRTLF